MLITAPGSVDAAHAVDRDLLDEVGGGQLGGLDGGGGLVVRGHGALLGCGVDHGLSHSNCTRCKKGRGHADRYSRRWSIDSAISASRSASSSRSHSAYAESASARLT